MTDITELAQREKFEAWAEEAGALPWGILGKHRKQDGNYPGPHYTYMWKAWQAASAELVEALEKAQRANAAQDDHINQQQDRIDILEKRNAELGREVIRLQSLKTVNAARQEAESEFHRGYSCGHKDASLESRHCSHPAMTTMTRMMTDAK